MFSNGDPYRKLHRRRRRDPRTLALAGFALLTVGCGVAAAAMLSEDTAAAAPATDQSPIVAMLTARDAVGAAVSLSMPEPTYAAPLPKLPDEPLEPTTWADGLDVTLKGSVRKNETISVSIGNFGVPQSSIQKVVMAMDGTFDFRRSRIGDQWEVDVRSDGEIQRFRYQSGKVDVWESVLSDNGYATKRIDVPVESRVEVVTGEIRSSLWGAFESSGAGGNLAVAYASVFAYTIDFTTETQPGDKFALAYESTWLDGERLSTGRILAARYDGNAGNHYAFYFEDRDGSGAYYDETGESVERQFLRSPLATVRITSRFGKRFHPVLGRQKMHHGVDYGAPIGTPIQAVADGTVTYAGWKGANGKLIALRHAGGYVTYYAHLSKIDSDVRVGQRVKKKDVIGRVGNTGRSTGPHLHFGMKRYGKYVNPLQVDHEKGVPLGGAEKKRYLAAMRPVKAKLGWE